MRKRRLRGDGRGERGCTLLRADAFWAVCVMCVVVCACVEFCKTFIGHHTHALTQPVPERPRTTHAARSNNMPLCPAVPRACSRVSSLHTLRSSLAAPPSFPAQARLRGHMHATPARTRRSWPLECRFATGRRRAWLQIRLAARTTDLPGPLAPRCTLGRVSGAACARLYRVQPVGHARRPRGDAR